jgi:hypothetical protein
LPSADYQPNYKLKSPIKDHGTYHRLWENLGCTTSQLDAHTLFAITYSTKSAPESPSVLFAYQFKEVSDRSLCQGTTSVVPKIAGKQWALAPERYSLAG